MKKLAVSIVVLVVVSLFLVAYSNGDINEGISDEPIEPIEPTKDVHERISIEPNDTAAGPCDYEYKDIITVRNEAGYRQRYVLRLSEEPEVLAEFLYATSELDEFVEVDAEDPIEHAVEVFSRDEDIHQQALERAKEVFASMQIDCNWEELRKIDPVGVEEEHKAFMEQNDPTLPLVTDAETGKPISYKAFVELNTPTPPLATNAGTGEPISDEPAGPWGGPTD